MVINDAETVHRRRATTVKVQNTLLPSVPVKQLDCQPLYKLCLTKLGNRMCASKDRCVSSRETKEARIEAGDAVEAVRRAAQAEGKVRTEDSLIHRPRGQRPGYTSITESAAGWYLYPAKSPELSSMKN